jgi:hypothetical protein
MKTIAAIILALVCFIGAAYAQTPATDETLNMVLSAINTVEMDLGVIAGMLGDDIPTQLTGISDQIAAQIPLWEAQHDMLSDQLGALLAIQEKTAEQVFATWNLMNEVSALRQDVASSKQTLEFMHQNIEQLLDLANGTGLNVNVVNAVLEVSGQVVMGGGYLDYIGQIGYIDGGHVSIDSMPEVTVTVASDGLKKGELDDSLGSAEASDVGNQLQALLAEEQYFTDDPDSPFLQEDTMRNDMKDQAKAAGELAVGVGANIKVPIRDVNIESNSVSRPVTEGDNQHPALGGLVERYQDKIQGFIDSIFPSIGQQAYMTLGGVQGWEDGLPGAGAGGSPTRKLEWFDGVQGFRSILLIVPLLLVVGSIYGAIGIIGGVNAGGAE